MENKSLVSPIAYPMLDLTGTKVWVGGPSPKPTIEIQLYRDGESLGEPAVLVHGETNHTLADLDLTDEDGREYVYTVDEVEVPSKYTKEISKDGLTVTNTIKPIETETPEVEEPQESQTSKSEKIADHEEDDLVQTGTDINLLIPIGLIIILLGAAYVLKDKFARR